MMKEPSAAQKRIGDFAPKLVESTDDVPFGDVGERPGPSKRDRSLITVGALIALNRTEQLRFHIERALCAFHPSLGGQPMFACASPED
jgi:4-carboxymuconolactone decarboxylase